MPEKTADLPLSCSLIKYSVLHLHTEVKNDEHFSMPLSVTPEIRFDIGKDEYKAFVKCVYAVDGFAFSCGIEGMFRYCQPIDGKNLISAWYNACTMIYGIMRGIFTTTSSQSIHTAKFLPSVMMINEIKRRIKEIAENDPPKGGVHSEQIPAQSETKELE